MGENLFWIGWSVVFGALSLLAGLDGEAASSAFGFIFAGVHVALLVVRFAWLWEEM